MRIAVFHNLPSGGAKRALHGFVGFLRSAGHHIDAFLPDTADERYCSLAPLVNSLTVWPVRRTPVGMARSLVRYLPPLRHSLADFERVQRTIAERINASECDVVLVEQDFVTQSPFILRFLRRPAVYYCQQPYRGNEAILHEAYRHARPSPARRFWRRHVSNRIVPGIDRANARASTYTVANSYYSRECILRAYGTNAFVSYLGVDTGVFTPQSAPRESFVLSVGSLLPNKGQDFIIRSLAQLAPPLRPALVLVGNAADPVWLAYLQTLADSRGVQIRIHAMVDDASLVSFYSRACAFLYAPYLEPFGLAPLEAMACGTPVLAVREAGVRESVRDGETGVLVDRDETSFADALRQLLEHPAQRARFGASGLESVRAFWTLAHAGQRLEAHLARAIERYASAGLR